VINAIIKFGEIFDNCIDLILSGNEMVDKKISLFFDNSKKLITLSLYEIAVK
jgi:hypothetical protein